MPLFSLYWHKFSRHVTSRLWRVLNGTPNPINHTIFWKNSRRSFRCTQMFCPNCNLFFAVISRKYKAIFNILMTITLEVNIIFSQVTTFFKLVNTGILFLIKFAKFWHITCFFSQFDTNMAPISWTTDLRQGLKYVCKTKHSKHNLLLTLIDWYFPSWFMGRTFW